MSVAGARNDTIIHGFVTDPDGRWTYSFFFGAALALSLSATWSALHLDVLRKHGLWYILCRKIGWTLLVAPAAEYIVNLATQSYIVARSLLKKIVH